MYSGGSGTEGNPYLIATAEDLFNVRFNKNAHFKQTKNISLKQYADWIPLVYDDETKANISAFNGSYDGNWYKIIHLTCRDIKFASFFGEIGPDAAVERVSIKGAVIEPIDTLGNYSSAAILSITINGKVRDCEVSGKVTGYYAFGFARYIDNINALVERCSSDVEVLGYLYSIGFIERTHLIYPQYPNSDIEYALQIFDCYAKGSVRNIYYEMWGSVGTAYFLGFALNVRCKNCYSVVLMYNEPEPRERDSGWYSGLFIYGSTPKYESLESCYIDVDECGPQVSWKLNRGYYSRVAFVRGTDGKNYTCIRPQSYYNDWEYDEGRDEWVAVPFIEAQPIVGSQWSEYWQDTLSVDSAVARTTAQMKTKENYVGWDFENVWKFTAGKYPTLRKSSEAQLEAMPLTSITVVN